MKYKITAVVEQDKEYMDADQIKELSSDIQMNIADYNYFRIIEDVKAEEYRPDMREKIKEYIDEMDEEINRCDTWVKEHINNKSCDIAIMESRIETLTDVKNDLESRLDEVI